MYLHNLHTNHPDTPIS